MSANRITLKDIRGHSGETGCHPHHQTLRTNDPAVWAAETKPSAASNLGSRKTILIADDDADLVELLAMRCRAMGLNVRRAHDARTALNSIFDSRPDVACLDLSMPGGNGLGVCEMLVSDGRFADMPIILLTGSTDPETVRRCHALCAYYVPKCANLWGRIGPLLRELLPSLGAHHDESAGDGATEPN